MAELQHLANEIRGEFQEKLNRHGYGFHYAVLSRAKRAIEEEHISKWTFEAAEVPIRSQSRDSKIDFVLSRGADSSQLRWYAVCECKRVNPARGHWCFVRAPSTHRKRHAPREALLFETLEINEAGEIKATSYQGNHVAPYGIGLAIKARETGDKIGPSDDDAIEKAASQVMLGVNGFMNMLSATPHIVRDSPGKTVCAFLLPIIFTTAKLWVSEVSLSDANLGTGEINLCNSSSKIRLGFGFRITCRRGYGTYSREGNFQLAMAEMMDDDYVRHIAVVNVEGIDDFLQVSSNSEYLMA
jgi:hypothetical protein